MAESYTDGEIAGIVIGCLIGIPLVIFLILFALRMWMRGPTKGSDSTKKLDGKLVVITGKLNWVSSLKPTKSQNVFSFSTYLNRNHFLSTFCLYSMPGSLHILVTSFFVFLLSRMTKIIFYVCLLTHFARQDRQNGNFKNKTKSHNWSDQNTKKRKWNF